MYEAESCIRDFYVQLSRGVDALASYIGEQLDCTLDSGNIEHPFAVAVQKDGVMIGHVLRTTTLEVLCCISSYPSESPPFCLFVTQSYNPQTRCQINY